MIGDGAITLAVERIAATGAECQVRSGGHAQGRPGVHLPSERLRIQAPTPEDLALAAAMAAEGVDFLAVSFVRDADDIIKVREAIAPLTARLVAKIETLSAIEHLDDDHRCLRCGDGRHAATSASSARSKTCRTCRSRSFAAASAPAFR